MKTISEMTVKEFNAYKNKPLSTILREQKVNEKLAMMGTKTTQERNKTHEHKPDNNIRLQITIDCRIL